MNVGLIDVDSKIPNLALMKISAYHKAQGDTVNLYNPLFDIPDLVYASKVFRFTPDYTYFPQDIPVIKGGTGYSLTDALPEEIENICPDYSLYRCEYAIGFTTRGCSRNCPFCVVPQKEGYIRAVDDIYGFWRGQSEIVLLDNNLTALPDQFEMVCKQLIKEMVRVDFSQGLDIRFITSDMAKLISKVKLKKQIHFAWDNMEDESAVRRGIDVLIKSGVSKHKLMFYVLIGFNTTPDEDLHRVETLRGLGIDPFIMPYNKADPYQRKFARWVNHKAIFKTVKWADYKAG